MGRQHTEPGGRHGFVSLQDEKFIKANTKKAEVTPGVRHGFVSLQDEKLALKLRAKLAVHLVGR